MTIREYSSELGEGEERDPNPVAGIKFVLDGEQFECLGEVNILDESDLALLATEARGDLTRPEAQAAVSAYLRTALGDQEYLRFKAHTKQHHTRNARIMDIVGDLVTEVTAAIEGLTGRPTERPSPSSAGPQDPGERISRLISLGTGDIMVLPGDHTAAEMAAARTQQRAKRKAGSRSGNPAKRAAAGG